MEDIKPYIKSLMKYLGDNDYTKKPFPKVVLNHSPQDPIFGKTAYYSPDEKKVVLFVANRLHKDILRSLAHELIHHKQNLEGRLNDGDYNGENIIDDDKLKKLEIEAYTDGNIGFRSWTEEMQN